MKNYSNINIQNLKKRLKFKIKNNVQKGSKFYKNDKMAVLKLIFPRTTQEKHKWKTPYEAPHKCKDVSSHEYEMMVNVGQQEDINKYVCLHKCLCYINLSFYVKHIQHFDHTNFISWDNFSVSRME